MAKNREPAWATRLRDLRRDFVAANKRSRLRFVLVQTIGASVKGLQPSVDENCSPMRTAVTLGDGTPAIRWVYRFGRDDDPAISLIERGNDILNRHGDEILQLFSLKFVDSSEGNWPWLLARLAEVEHPFRGDIKSDRTLAGVASPNEMAEAVAFTLGQGQQPNWLAARNKSFRADIPHVAVASIAAIRAILERVESDDSASVPAKPPDGGDGPFGLGCFRWRTLKPRCGLRLKPFRLLTFLWNAKDRTATFDELAEDVWDDKQRNGHALRNDSRLGSARRAVNEFMEAGPFPFRVETSPQNELVWLIESTTQPITPAKTSAGKKARRSPRPARQ